MGVEFITVNVSTTGLYATSTRDYGTVAIIGDGDTANLDPVKLGTYAEAVSTYGTSALGTGAKLAFQNGASCVWAVDCGTPTLSGVQEALAKIEGYDIQIVALAGIVETVADAYVSTALANHVYAAATERVGVFQLAAAEDATTMPTAIGGMLTANKSRMFGIAHNSTNDVACAVAGRLASLKPWESPFLKALVGVTQLVGFTNTQISALETSQLNVLVDPLYLTGSDYVLGSAFVMGTSNSGIQYVDTRRTIDDIAYKLKATLTDPNIIGTVRIDKPGLATLMNKLAGLLQTCVNDTEIDSYEITIPVLSALAKDASARSGAETTLISTARTTRTVSVDIEIVYVGVLHKITINVNIVAA